MAESLTPNNMIHKPVIPNKPEPVLSPNKPEPNCSIHISCSNKIKILLVLSTTFLLLFLLLFFIMLGGAHIHVSVRDPTIAAFQVASPTFSNSSSSGNQVLSSSIPTANNSTFVLNTDVVLSMDVKNPTPHWGTYYYEALKWHLTYEDIVIASGLLPPFTQGALTTERTRKVRLQGANIAVPTSLAFALQSNDTTLNMEAGTSFYVHLEGSPITFGFVIHCNLTFPHTIEGYTRLPKPTTCLVADQDRGHY